MADQQPKHTPGPYEMGAVPGSHDAALYSSTTGELVATVHSGANHGDAPPDQTALHNAALLRAAPRMRESLEKLLGEHEKEARTPARDAARGLLAELSAGPDERFLEERNEELRGYEEYLDEQAKEMEMQGRPYLDMLAQELEEEEELGHSF